MSNLDKSPERRAADILLRGGKMLALACPVCSSPLYQTKDGDVICVVCNRPVKILSKKEYEKEMLKDKDTQKKEDLTNKNKLISKQDKNTKNLASEVKEKEKTEIKHNYNNINNSIMNAYDTLSNKLEEIMMRIRTEHDLSTLERLLSVVEKIIDLMLLIEEEY